MVKERNRAEAARASAEERNDALTLVQARTSLDRDLTAALAWLATYRAEAANQDLMRSLLADAAARGVARHILPFTDWVQGVAFARGGRLLIAADYARKLRLFDTREGRLLGEWERPGGTAQLLVLEAPLPAGSPSPGAAADPKAGLRVLTGGADGRLLLHDLASGEVRDLAGHTATITEMKLLQDGKTCISSSRDGSVYSFDLDSGAGRLLARHAGSASSVAVTADEQLAVSGGRDGNLQLIGLAGAWRDAAPWLIPTGQPVAAPAIASRTPRRRGRWSPPWATTSGSARGISLPAARGW